MLQAPWRFWVDRGGTFTDIVARKPDGTLVTYKLLSSNPEQYGDAAVAGIRHLLQVPAGERMPVEQIAEVRMGTTVATNALLERKGEKTLLAITRGFRDALRIAYQDRPRIFDCHIELPELLYSQVIEIEERVSAHGEIMTALDKSSTCTALVRAYNEGYRSIAIVLMHGYRYSQHELEIANMARAMGYTSISTSHEVSPLIKLVSRGDTTTVDAYLSPLLRRYVDQITAALKNVPLCFMQSNGGLAEAQHFHGKDAILSGPAGGVVGAVRTALAEGYHKLIGFDMGGTSTDVWHFSGTALSDMERSFENRVAGVRMRAPMMNIHTVAAGGGSILHFDGARSRVGPDSAGANPGPACYRRGGPLTLTDCNVVLGRIQPGYFPAVFGADGKQAFDAEAVAREFRKLARHMADATGHCRVAEQIAAEYVEIAVGNMANAIKRISVQRGHDISDYTLCCFGGAAGQHACQVADALGMKRILIHPLAGVLSAYGIGLADLAVVRVQSVDVLLVDGNFRSLQDEIEKLSVAAAHELQLQGVSRQRITLVGRVHIRYEGTDTALCVAMSGISEMKNAFESAYRMRYSFLMPDRTLVAEAISVEATGTNDTTMPPPPSNASSAGEAQAAATVKMYLNGAMRAVPLYQRDLLPTGCAIAGPAIIAETNATTVVDPGWRADVTSMGQLLLTRAKPVENVGRTGTAAEPAMLEIFNNLYMSIAEQMGVRLANTAHSVNIKERLDFSCALFDAHGNLIANAPHMPVHLGSMGASIRTVIDGNRGNNGARRMRPGDVYMLNNPYNGGTHLPDITVITPVFGDDGKTIIFYVGSRGHHADIGGMTPGSMPPASRIIHEEGVLIDNFLLVEAGRLRETETVALLSSGTYPCRNIAQNMADLRAMIAANEKGSQELRCMVQHYGLKVVHAYMQHVQDYAEECVRRVIERLHDGEFEYAMDHGAVIRVAVSVNKTRRSAAIDFAGTSAQLDNNFNAPTAVCLAAVLYVFRSLVNEDIPLNAGCMRPLEVIIPEGSMLNPRCPAAVAAGNVETSQCVTDALYGALRIMGASQGTMNNFTLGNEHHQYYETIAGGSGAGNGFDGTDVVQTHMTNSRLTDPEVLEWRFPVLLEEFSIRRGSGGRGRWRGGDGAIRRMRFLEPMTAAIMSGHRTVRPYGMAGGEAGMTGRNYVVRCNGSVLKLEGCDEVAVNAGDTFVIETPGGGGYGHINS